MNQSLLTPKVVSAVQAHVASQLRSMCLVTHAEPAGDGRFDCQRLALSDTAESLLAKALCLVEEQVAAQKVDARSREAFVATHLCLALYAWLSRRSLDDKQLSAIQMAWSQLSGLCKNQPV